MEKLLEFLGKRLLEQYTVDIESLSEVENLLDLHLIDYWDFWKAVEKKINLLEGDNTIGLGISLYETAIEVIREKEKEKEI